MGSHNLSAHVLEVLRFHVSVVLVPNSHLRIPKPKPEQISFRPSAYGKSRRHLPRYPYWAARAPILRSSTPTKILAYAGPRNIEIHPGAAGVRCAFIAEHGRGPHGAIASEKSHLPNAFQSLQGISRRRGRAPGEFGAPESFARYRNQSEHDRSESLNKIGIARNGERYRALQHQSKRSHGNSQRYRNRS